MGINRLYNQARLVEEFIDKMVGQEDYRTEILSVPWRNGREKGLCFSWDGSVIVANWDGKELTFTQRRDKTPLEAWGPFAYVAEHRSSDDLSITMSKFDEWSMVTEEEYKARRFFKYNEYILCAEQVLEELGVPGECWERLS